MNDIMRESNITLVQKNM